MFNSNLMNSIEAVIITIDTDIWLRIILDAQELWYDDSLLNFFLFYCKKICLDYRLNNIFTNTYY